MKEMRYILMVLMLALIGVQSDAINYPVYQPSGRQVAGPAFTPATAPNATFQSTSAMPAGSGSSTFCSTLNADGTVNEEAYGVGSQDAPKIRRVGGTPGQGGIQQPLGDAMLPLMLLACAYMCLRAFLKRKRATES